MIEKYKNIFTSGFMHVSQYSSILLFGFFLFPTISFAFPASLIGAKDLFFETFTILIPILNFIAFLVFSWGIAKFILSAGDEKEIAKGKQFMIWGIIAIFVLVSFMGILNFLSDQFGFGPVAWPLLPE
jgi:hypothetical protein